MDNKDGNHKIVIKLSGSFNTLLQIIFIVLKLCKVINWSWLWVLSPLWISTILAIVCFIISVIIITIRIKKNK